jgi:hypothetical protein
MGVTWWDSVGAHAFYCISRSSFRLREFAFTPNRSKTDICQGRPSLLPHYYSLKTKLWVMSQVKESRVVNFWHAQGMHRIFWNQFVTMKMMTANTDQAVSTCQKRCHVPIPSYMLFNIICTICQVGVIFYPIMGGEPEDQILYGPWTCFSI